ncbi:MAG: TonB family protein [Elusimicrobia bacterium]|jgi:TonB family protein|nr:TonB family protein [Elusimicrobiota bacterium]
MLAVNEHIFGSFRETLCVTLALAIHVPLYFWQARPIVGSLADPIAEIDFSVEEVVPEKPAPLPPVEEKKEDNTFFKRVKEAVGLSTPKPMPKLIVSEKPKAELVGASTPNQIQSLTRAAEAIQKDSKLVNKERSLASSFDVGKIETKSAGGLAGVGLGAGEKVGGGGTIKDKSSGFKIARGDLPFAVQKGGAGLTSSDGDAPQIALANRTDKRVKTVSTAFFGTGGGTGGGDGAGAGGGGNLKDKEGGRGLVGVSGGFSPIGAPGTSSSGGGLVGTPGGGNRGTAGASSSRVPYEISGPLSGRRILYQVMPVFPEWAREKGIFATVILDFFVRQTGEVNTNKTVVSRSCGYSKIDILAQEALNQWRFEALDLSMKGKEQYGQITFRFKAL